MRKLVSGLAAAAFLALGPVAVSGQVQLGPTLAWGDDGADFGIGATLGARLPSLGEGVGVMADFIIFFPDNSDYFEVNGNITYDFPIEGSTVLPFALAGLNIARASNDVFSNTEVGLNLGGGLVFDAGDFRPQVGGRFEIDGGEQFVVFITLPFQVSN